MGNKDSVFSQNRKSMKLCFIMDWHFIYIIGYSNKGYRKLSSNTVKIKWFKSHKLIYGDPYNSVTTTGQILNITSELSLEIKDLGKLFIKSTFTVFAINTWNLKIYNCNYKYYVGCRKNCSEMLFKGGVLQICSKCAGEQPCKKTILIKLHNNFCINSMQIVL